MSLYILGKIVSPSHALVGVGACLNVVGSSLRTSLDDDDLEVLEELLPGSGAVFSIVDEEGGVDATQLWTDATAAAVRWGRGRQQPLHLQADPPDEYLEAIAGTKLATIVRCLTSLRGYESLGLAFVDGGISTVWRGTAAEVYRAIAWEWRLPWDQSSNRLYVWSPE